MIIHILCRDGSPLGVTSKDVYGEGQRGIGIGGSELALLTMCEEWTKAGHDVVLYNNPLEPNASIFEQRHTKWYQPKEVRDVLIVFRTPQKNIVSANGLKVFWSCDQYTSVDFKPFFPEVDKVVTISPRHAQYFKAHYGYDQSITIDLPVRLDDYHYALDKVPGQCLFSSVPDRGLQILHAAWPLISRDFPKASLVITSDYRLWGLGDANNNHHKFQWTHHKNVRFIGAVPRRTLIEEQIKSQVLTYPCTYDELFCISASEAQVAGAIPVTTEMGALATTNMGIKIPGRYTDPKWVTEFVRNVVTLLSDPNLKDHQQELSNRARERFSPKRILAEWNERVFR